MTTVFDRLVRRLRLAVERVVIEIWCREKKLPARFERLGQTTYELDVVKNMLNYFCADNYVESVVEIAAVAEETKVLNVESHTWIWVSSLAPLEFGLGIAEPDDRMSKSPDVCSNRTIATSCVENR